MGTPPPAGKTRRSPAAATFSAAKLNETAAADTGMPHFPVMVKLRVALAASEGGPYAPEKPPPRVSASRHGVIAMKGRGTGTVLKSWGRASPGARTAGGVHRRGDGQLYTSCAPAMVCLSVEYCPNARGA